MDRFEQVEWSIINSVKTELIVNAIAFLAVYLWMPILVVFRVLSDSILGTDKLKSILPYKFEKAKSSLTPLFDENFIFQTCVHNSTVSPNNFFIHTMCYNEFQSERHSVYFFLIAKGCTWGKETEKDQTIIKKIIYLVPKEAYSEIVLNIYHFKIYNIFFSFILHWFQ